jgi:hypothetical protein
LVAATILMTSTEHPVAGECANMSMKLELHIISCLVIACMT